MNIRVLRWELIGVAFITILGSVLHFVFAWSGQWEPIGVVAAVNESVWEHLKLGFWPALFYAGLEFGFWKRCPSNFIIAKTAGIYVIPAAIVVLFYAYTAIIGKEILAVDISIFVIAVWLGQLTSYRILNLKQLPRWLNYLGIFLILVLALAFGVFTFYPPQLPIFQDGLTGAYGILK
jgi:hypothetical protein